MARVRKSQVIQPVASCDHQWQFPSRFRRHAFGWRSDTPIQRIREAVSEIKQVARKNPAYAAEGAVLFLEKLSPAIEQVDSSSGAIGTAVNRAIETLVPIIAKATVEPSVRRQWMSRLWEAIQDDNVPYLETLTDRWGELCATEEIATLWADDFLPLLKSSWSHGRTGAYFKGTTACLSSLLMAGRHEELVALVDAAPYQWWHYRRFAVKALMCMGRAEAALRYAEASRGLNDPGYLIAQACEEILLSSGRQEEAYNHYALEANRQSTHLGTFRAILKKYPHKTAEAVLRDLMAITPGQEGKWFAAAKEAGFFDLAADIVMRSPADPKTLTRAANDFAQSQPGFAVKCGFAALRWMADGYGYDLTGADVLAAYFALKQALPASGMNADTIMAALKEMAEGTRSGSHFINKALARHLV